MALTAQEDILPKILGQQEVAIHVHVLEAARKSPATQLDGAGPSRCRGRGSCRSRGHRTGGHAGPGRAALMPEPQLQDP